MQNTFWWRIERKTGFDTFLPGVGLLIWHIDESSHRNDDENHKLVDLEEADGQNDLDKRVNSGNPNDCWVNSANGFNRDSNPNSNLYDETQSGIGVKNISPAGSTMSIDLIVDDFTPGLPFANFTSNVTNGYAPLSVQFTDLSKNAASWYWDFGDSVTSTEQNPRHKYSIGSFTVKLTVSNSAGMDKITKTSYINVGTTPPLIADFSASPSLEQHP